MSYLRVMSDPAPVPRPLVSRAVWLLSGISLLTDLASELLYPVMPGYLRHIGFSVVLIGLLEGVAEATAGLSKAAVGRWSDRVGRRVPFVRAGYALSALAKPLLALTVHPLGVFLARTAERFGKGLRTAPRDALLAAEATPATRGRVFGLHRAMDTLGAVLGPLAALWWLTSHPGAYRPLFLLAAIPGALAIGVTLLLREPPRPLNALPRAPLPPLRVWWRTAPAPYQRVVRGLAVFALLNSSDVFLLLAAREAGLREPAVIGAYIFYNLVYAAAAYPLGGLADRWGARPTVVGGLLIFAGTYAGLALAHGLPMVLVLFALYGLYAAATESVAKAWLAQLVPPAQTGTAFGLYGTLQSFGALGASLLTGLLWQQFGAPAALLTTAGGTLGVALYLAWLPKSDGMDT